MTFYSRKSRLKLAWWFKLFLIINIAIFLIEALILWLSEDLAAFDGRYSSILGFFVAILIYGKLTDSKENSWMVLAEILGTANVFLSAASYLIIIITILLGISISGG